MSALLNEDERALREAVRSFLDKKVAPLVAAHERARTFPWELLPQLYDFGYVRGGVPEAAGGDGLPMMMQAILMEEAGRCWGSLRTTVNVQGMVARVLGAAADAGQAERFLQPLLAPVRLVRADRAGRGLGRRRAADHRPPHRKRIRGEREQAVHH
jgi:alkylation response protein AidB-like acyl-CoA dehydrogenase